MSNITSVVCCSPADRLTAHTCLLESSSRDQSSQSCLHWPRPRRKWTDSGCGCWAPTLCFPQLTGQYDIASLPSWYHNIYIAACPVHSGQHWLCKDSLFPSLPLFLLWSPSHCYPAISCMIWVMPILEVPNGGFIPLLCSTSTKIGWDSIIELRDCGGGGGGCGGGGWRIIVLISVAWCVTVYYCVPVCATQSRGSQRPDWQGQDRCTEAVPTWDPRWLQVTTESSDQVTSETVRLTVNMSKEEGGGDRSGGGGSQENPQAQYVGPYRLEKTLGKGQTGWLSVCQRNLIIA